MSVESFSSDGDFGTCKQDIPAIRAFVRAALSIVDGFSGWTGKDLETIGRTSNFFSEIDQGASTSVEGILRGRQKFNF